uniref:Uncharacterized protein n=1 Tax=Mus musculus TaxID=10090 RepID=Q3TNR0_MOUSE|nr:unnamed protein product [Mus musculus]
MCGSRFSIISSSSFRVAMGILGEPGAGLAGSSPVLSGLSLSSGFCWSSLSRSILGRGALPEMQGIEHVLVLRGWPLGSWCQCLAWMQTCCWCQAFCHSHPC